eukprot:233922_1
MFLLDVAYALATTLTAFTLYLFISWKDPGVSWGGAFDSRSLFAAYMSVLNLGLNYSKHSTQYSTNWRPSFLLIHLNTKNNHSKNAFNDGVTYFVETLRKGHGLIFAAEICIGDFRTIALNKINKLQTNTPLNNNNSNSGYLPARTHISSRTHFKGKRVNGFLNKIISTTHRNGVQIALQTTGIGVLKPNTIVIGMKNENCYSEITNKTYVEILRDSLLSGYGIMIPNGFNGNKIDWNLKRYNIYNCDNIIDIWWLVDDGGLILLLPYIMCLHNFFYKMSRK